MTSRELVIQALRFETLDRIPTELADVCGAPWQYPAGKSWGIERKKGRRMDIWGCIWEMAEDEVCGEVKNAPLSGGDWAGLARFQPPWEALDGADLSRVNAAHANTDKFMIPMLDPMPNPFERMQHLRGTEQLLLGRD